MTEADLFQISVSEVKAFTWLFQQLQYFNGKVSTNYDNFNQQTNRPDVPWAKISAQGPKVVTLRNGVV